MPHTSSPSPVAQRLAWAGLAPLALGTLLIALLDSPGYEDLHAFVSGATSIYAALIIAFVGALHWGISMTLPATDQRTALWIWSVVPGLLAWLAALMPPWSGLIIHGILLPISYLMDRRHYPDWNLQAWLTLRFRLTVIASFLCFLAAVNS